MKKQLFIKRKVLLFVLNTFFFLSMLNAQDTISFTWKGSVNEKQFGITAASNDTITINWGDDSTSIHIFPYNQSGESQIYPKHIYTDSNDYNVFITSNENSTISMLSVSSLEISHLEVISQDIKLIGCSNNRLISLDLSDNSSLEWLDCSNNKLQTLTLGNLPNFWFLWCQDNQLTSLDVTGCPSLGQIECRDNDLQNLDLSQNTKLTTFGCARNQLNVLDLNNNLRLITLDCSGNFIDKLDLSQNDSLSHISCDSNLLSLGDLYAASEKIQNQFAKRLGTQILSAQNVIQNKEYTITEDYVLSGNTTQFIVKKGQNQAVLGTDYQLNNDKIIFLSIGNFTIEMTNAAIISSDDKPAKVIAQYNVFEQNSLAMAQLSSIGTFVYTGNEIKPKPEVRYEGSLLTEKVDYEFSYQNNINAGVAQLFLQGIGNYRGGMSVTFQIEKASQTITFPELGEVELKVTNLDPEATASSGLPVKYESSNKDVAYINWIGWISLAKIGETEITATQPGNENYLPAEPVIRTLKIIENKVSITDVENQKIKIYPNPVNDILNIESQDPIIKIIIYDINGTIVKQMSNPGDILFLDDLIPAIYLVKVVTEKGISFYKIIKE